MVPNSFSGLDFNRFFPVQHKKTSAYFAIDVAENPDFDIATETDKFVCHPVPPEGAPELNAQVFFSKADLQSIPLML